MARASCSCTCRTRVVPASHRPRRGSRCRAPTRGSQPIPPEVLQFQPPTPVRLTSTAVARSLREAKRGSAPGLSVAHAEHYKLLLGHADDMELLTEAANLLAQAQVLRSRGRRRPSSHDSDPQARWRCARYCNGGHVSSARVAFAGCRVGAGFRSGYQAIQVTTSHSSGSGCTVSATPCNPGKRCSSHRRCAGRA